ncbi:MAG: hypothetical protein AB1798_10595 [Spirochaetota bacterium]
MKRSFRSIILSIVFIALLFSPVGSEVFSEDTDEFDFPPWILLEKGKKAYHDREFGTAIRYFRTAIQKEGEFPEAEMWVGAVFEEEGEYILAEKQYLKALEIKKLLYIPEDEYTILYKLTEIYRNSNQYKKMEDTLISLLSKDEIVSGDAYASLRLAYVRTLKEKGLNKLVELYRHNNVKTQDAHSQLGIFYYRTGRYGNATLNLLFTVLTVFSVCIDELRKFDPDYTFSNTEDFLEISLKEPRLKEFIEVGGFFKNLYYLGSSLSAEGELLSARYLWRIVATYATAAFWKDRAQRQMKAPFVEPLIEVQNGF